MSTHSVSSSIPSAEQWASYLRASAEQAAPPPPWRRRRRVDSDFVRFLIDYAANDPECPPLFKAYLEDVVLKPCSNPEDRVLRVEYHLRNPEITKYTLGERFRRKLDNYTISSNVFGTGPVVPSAAIPEQYRPNTGAQPADDMDIDFAIYPSEIDQESVKEKEDEKTQGDHNEDEEETLSRMRDRLRTLEEGGQSSEETDSSILETLQSIPSFGISEALADAVTLEDMRGPDRTTASSYKGRRMLPLAEELERIVTFLKAEDVDRCVDWKTNFEEVVSYLEWLAHGDEDHQLQNAGLSTRTIFDDAVTKAKAHALFEKHCYDPVPLDISSLKLPKGPLLSTRLRWMAKASDWPLPCHSPVPDQSELLPRAIPPRPPSPVNRILLDNPDSSECYKTFTKDEKKWWDRIGGALRTIPTDASRLERNNLAYIESQAFDAFSAGDSIGWIRRDPATGMTLLPDDTLVAAGNAQHWARERGARRAGLQQMLRAFRNPNARIELDRPRPGLVFPVDAATLRAVCRSVNGPQWTPIAVDKSLLPGNSAEGPWESMDPMHTTVYCVSYFETLRKIRERAMLAMEAASTLPVKLPKNLANGGPFVWRAIDSEEQARQDLRRECLKTLRILKQANRRAPRPLLQEVLDQASQAQKGGFDFQQKIPGVNLASDEWEQDGSERHPRPLDSQEIQWLRFLAGECVNAKTWNGRFVPDTPREKYRLFLIFARRVQKLLDDKKPKALFGRADARVEVEQLLAAINAGKDSSPVTKCEFQPFDACSWLDRMDKSGHVRFYLDPACYGVVQRPPAEYFPEHRVLWPKKQDPNVRPSYLGYIADWRDVVPGGNSEGGALPDIDKGSAIYNFFASLGFRLGHTIYATTTTTSTTPIITRHLRSHLRSAILEWDHACKSARHTPEPKPPTKERLTTLRTAIIDELSANATMLHPSRRRERLNRRTNQSDDGETADDLVRDHNWDWAALGSDDGQRSNEQRQRQRHRQFWSMDRWPAAAAQVKQEREEPPTMTIRALQPDDVMAAAQAADPTDRRYMRPKLRPYGEEDKVLYRPGPAVYPIGDTRLQRLAVERRITEMVNRAAGLRPKERKKKPTATATLVNALSSWLVNPLSRFAWKEEKKAAKYRADEDPEGGKLPPVSLDQVPRSWDPEGEWERRMQQEAPAAAAQNEQQDGDQDVDMQEDEDEDEDGLKNVDVAMTGMGQA